MSFTITRRAFIVVLVCGGYPDTVDVRLRLTIPPASEHCVVVVSTSVQAMDFGHIMPLPQ